MTEAQPKKIILRKPLSSKEVEKVTLNTILSTIDPARSGHGDSLFLGLWFPQGGEGAKGLKKTFNASVALLMVQAAIRTQTLMDKVEDWAQKHGALVAGHKENETKFPRAPVEGEVPFDDPAFRGIGSKKDPQPLRKAQGTWKAAQVYFNNEVEATRDAINQPGFVAGAYPLGTDYVGGFRAAAREMTVYAATFLAQDGHVAAARKLTALAEKMPADSVGKTPDQCMALLSHRFHQGSQSLAIVLSDDRYYEDDCPYIRAIDRLQNLTSIELNPAVKPGLKP